VGSPGRSEAATSAPRFALFRDDAGLAFGSAVLEPKQTARATRSVLPRPALARRSRGQHSWAIAQGESSVA
jgi:hypothetical protein